MPTQRSRELAAQAWCKPANSHKAMDGDLVEAFAEILDEELDRLRNRIDQLELEKQSRSGVVMKGESYLWNAVTK